MGVITMDINERDESLESEEYSYGYIIEVLTGGLYHNKFHVIREYIQNGFDAINTYNRLYDGNNEELEIEVYYKHPSLLIIDNGIGMNREKISQYRKIGYSEKRIGESVGFRGIGKLSGLSVAEKLIVTSKQRGTNERHKIIFDARSMLEEIISLKVEGQNTPLNSLIPKYTEISTEVDDTTDAHYTFVELFNIRQDSEVLFDEQGLLEYISINCPVRFNSNFQFSQEIEEKIKMYANGYSTVPINLNGKEVFKPYIDECLKPDYITIWNDEGDEPLAFCWYCENANKGQFENKAYSGFLYKYKNFTVGDRNLTRETLWLTAPERVFYFFGEIYICMDAIMPSSERSNFEHNDARDTLYSKCRDIPKQLNRIANNSSQRHRAVEKLESAEVEIDELLEDVENKKIPIEIQFDKAIETFNIVSDLEKRVEYLSDEAKQKAERVIIKGKNILKVLRRETKDKQINENTGQDINQSIESHVENNVKEIDYIDATYDMKEVLDLGEEASQVYDVIINVLKDHYIDHVPILEEIIHKIHRSLEKSFYRE